MTTNFDGVTVLHVVGAMNRGGAETMLMNLYRAIDPTRVRFEFIYFTDETCDFDAEIETLGGVIHRLPEASHASLLSRMRGIYRLLRKAPNISAVHFHTLLSSGFYALAAASAGVPTRIVHSHNTADSVTPGLARRNYELLAKLLIKWTVTDRIACGVAAGNYLFGRNPEVTILQNAVNLAELCKRAQSKTALLGELVNATSQSIVLLQVARLMPVKNHSFALDLISALQADGKDVRLAIVGDGPLTEETRDKAMATGIADVVFFLGVRDDVPELMGGADALILPSHFEGFPVVLVESQATGLPAIVSDQVSAEVDLDVGLITFAPIDNGSADWETALQNLADATPVDEQVRLKKLSAQGFDVDENASRLTRIYEA